MSETNLVDEKLIQNPAKSKFDSVLRNIQEHLFVTPDSVVYRNVMKNWLQSTKNKVGVDDLVFFPTGSVAVGMVSIEAGSDIDGVVVYSCTSDKTDSVSTALVNVDLPEEFNPFLVMSRVENRIEGFFERVDDVLMMNRPSMTDEIALLFAPSLSELSDEAEKSLVDGWRKQVIAKLALLPEGKGELVWGLMCGWLEKQFVHYEESDGGDQEKRKIRVESVIDKKISERISDDGERRERAKTFIDSLRSTFHYPSFDEMVLAYFN